MSKEILFLECQCTDPHHVIRYVLHKEGKGWPTELFISYQLNTHCGFFKRLKSAIYYVFSSKGKTVCTWHDTLLSRKETEDLKLFLEKALVEWKED